MEYGLFTLNHSVRFGLAPSLPRQFAAAAAAGFGLVGVDVASVLAHEELGTPPEALADSMFTAGLRCQELCPFGVSDDARTVEHDVDTLIRLARAFRPAVVEMIVPAVPTDKALEAARRGVERLGAEGFPCGVEFVAGWGVGTVATALDLVTALPAAGIVLDTWQYFRAEPDWSALDALDTDAISFIQFADGLEVPMADANDEMANHRRLPGQGALALDGFVERMLHKGYAGAVSVEVLDAGWRDRPVEDFARHAYESTKAIWERTH